MRIPKRVLAGALALACSVATALAGAGSALDGHPSQTRYVSNDAPFVVFGVTPTQLDLHSETIRLSFVATDRLEQVNVFPFVRATPGGPARMKALVPCGPREAGSWDCTVAVADLLVELEGAEGQLGLRIEAHGDLHERGEHSTVIVTVPVRRPGAHVSG